MSPLPHHSRTRKQPVAARRGGRPSEPSVYQILQADRPISGFATLPLRLFLGVTFVYAALQKVMDPGFFHAGSPTYIGAQILAFSRGSPIQGLLHQLMAYAVPIGILTVLTEGCIGLLVLLGLFTRPAALVGMALSMGFFLSASWQTYPYFFGSDIVFVVCWLTLAIAGPGVPALDAVVEAPLRGAILRRMGGRWSSAFVSLLTGWYVPRESVVDDRSLDATDGVGRATGEQSPGRRLSRGEALVGSMATLGLVALGLHPRRGRSSGPTGQLAGSQNVPPGAGAPSPKAGTATATPGSQAGIPTGARKIGNIRQLPANSAGTVNDPKTGDPAVIVHTSGSNFYAFDAICTHAGCTVQYDPQQKLLVCPCHGGTFDPAHGAQVVGGPPPSPLTPIDMTIDSHGDIYIV